MSSMVVVAGGGLGLAKHVMWSRIDYVTARGLGCWVWFVDVAYVSPSSNRELVFDTPHIGVDPYVNLFAMFGFRPQVINKCVEYIDGGSVLERVGVDTKSQRLMNV